MSVGGSVYKVNEEDDLYLVWSNICDGPMYWGPYAYISPIVGDPHRMRRAKDTGTSSLWDDEMRFWEKRSGLVWEQRGWMPWDNVKTALERLSVDDGDKLVDLLKPFDE